MICAWCQQKFVPKIIPWQLFVQNNQSINRLCERCQRQFDPLGKRRCPQCSREQPATEICSDCQFWRQIYGQQIMLNQAEWHYNRGFHDLMVAYKRYGDYELWPVLQQLAKPVQKIKADYFVPIPPSPEHLAQRQFDTIKAIFSHLVPLTHALAKAAGTSAQGEKTRAQRLQTAQSFFVKEDQPALRGKVVLLDDIYTTGRTLYHARDALQTAFPDCQISSFTIAR
jgi:competence protein ComFC